MIHARSARQRVVDRQRAGVTHTRVDDRRRAVPHCATLLFHLDTDGRSRGHEFIDRHSTGCRKRSAFGDVARPGTKGRLASRSHRDRTAIVVQACDGLR